jgi:hypothetical protein
VLLARQHFAPQCSAVPAGPNAAPGIRRCALVENDAGLCESAAAERNGQARGRGDADSLNGLRTDPPQHAVALAIGHDLDDARVSLSPGICAVGVIGAGDRLVGARCDRTECKRQGECRGDVV